MSLISKIFEVEMKDDREISDKIYLCISETNLYHLQLQVKAMDGEIYCMDTKAKCPFAQDVANQFLPYCRYEEMREEE